MVAVPVSSVPREFVDRFLQKASIQGILAAFLTHENASLLDRCATWHKTWPSRQHFQESCGLNYLTLPPSASGQLNLFSNSPYNFAVQETYQNVLVKQQKRLHDAWVDVLSVFPTTDWSLFPYHWLILNTRSFDYISPGKGPPDDWNYAI
ncbi:hypothetical protein N7491_009194 [Penicillium cf. griseofulvum]|nr:hypothetical protein N7491_009194 [Penicillium cf. griseofulvum]